jgi:hypothetical protein
MCRKLYCLSGCLYFVFLCCTERKLCSFIRKPAILMPSGNLNSGRSRDTNDLKVRPLEVNHSLTNPHSHPSLILYHSHLSHCLTFSLSLMVLFYIIYDFLIAYKISIILRYLEYCLHFQVVFFWQSNTNEVQSLL